MKTRMGLALPFIFSFLSLSSFAFAGSFRFALDTKNLSSAQIPAVQSLLNQASEKLPTLLKNRINQAVVVQFIETDPSIVGMAHKSKKEIILSTSLLPAIQKGGLPLDHSNLALATILHETTHIYDNTVTLSDDDLESLQECNDHRSYSPACQELRNPTYLSSQDAFRRVSGWYGNHYAFTFREDDAYEATNARETLAVNMEYFLLDSSFACRKPSLNRFLAKHFQWQPFPTGSCQINPAYVDSLAPSPKEVLNQLPVDRVYEIDYLHADKGSDLESRFGHSMFRLVICAPGKPLTEDCRKDISSHLVLSFRASVTDFETSALKGIIGDYPSRLFILPLTEVIQEYANGELRNLNAYPLKLTALEKQQFLERTLEYHWNYEGKYYFITNNCADESLNLLASSTLRPELLNLSITTPNGLFRALRDLKVLDDSVLADKKAAAEQGLFFQSYQARYDLALGKIQIYSGQKYDMKTWGNLDTDQRYALFQKELPQADAHQDRRALAASYFMLESSVQKKIENSYLNGIAGEILKEQQNNKGNAQSNAIAADAKEYLYMNSQLVNPSAILVGQKGYGLPSGDELSATANDFMQLGEKYQSTQKGMIDSIQSMFDPGLLKELQKIKDHLNIYLQMITTKPITKGT